MLLCFSLCDCIVCPLSFQGAHGCPTALPLWEVSWEDFSACLLALVFGPLPRRGLASAQDGHVSFASWCHTGLPSSQAGSHAQWGARDLYCSMPSLFRPSVLFVIEQNCQDIAYKCHKITRKRGDKVIYPSKQIQLTKGRPSIKEPHFTKELRSLRQGLTQHPGAPGRLSWWGRAPQAGKGFVALQGRWAKGRKSPFSLCGTACAWCSECSFNGPDHIVGRHLRVPRGDGWPASMVAQECGGQP